MNKRNLLLTRARVKNLIRISNRHRNVLKWGAGETDEHIQMKLEICKYLKRGGIEFYTEPILIDGSGRPDIIISDWEVIIEVVDSESAESILRKIEEYPLETRVVDAHQKFKEELIT